MMRRFVEILIKAVAGVTLGLGFARLSPAGVRGHGIDWTAVSLIGLGALLLLNLYFRKRFLKSASTRSDVRANTV
jgi:hypothetical protein